MSPVHLPEPIPAPPSSASAAQREAYIARLQHQNSVLDYTLYYSHQKLEAVYESKRRLAARVAVLQDWLNAEREDRKKLQAATAPPEEVPEPLVQFTWDLARVKPNTRIVGAFYRLGVLAASTIWSYTRERPGSFPVAGDTVVLKHLQDAALESIKRTGARESGYLCLRKIKETVGRPLFDEDLSIIFGAFDKANIRSW